MLRVQTRAGSVRTGSFAYCSSAESRESIVLCFSHLTIAKQWTVAAVSHANWRTAEVVFALRFNARSFKMDGQADRAKSARLWAVDMGCAKSENAGEITSEYYEHSTTQEERGRAAFSRAARLGMRFLDVFLHASTSAVTVAAYIFEKE